MLPFWSTVLVDARNGFNELGRKTMLWTVRHLWPSGSRFAFNCYRHSAQLLIRREGKEAHVILSQEGVTQGDPLSMILYGLALVPLSKTLREHVPATLQMWYADDKSIRGHPTKVAKVMEHLSLFSLMAIGTLGALLEAKNPGRNGPNP